MLMYILKFSACLLAFIAFYKVFLEQTSYNKFKRFYLIIALISAISIPFITFTKYIESQVILGDFTAIQVMPEDSQQGFILAEPIHYLPVILWSIYGLGVLIFSTKFLRNLIKIVLKIKSNPKLKTSNFINVLLQDLVVPHTFFSYIFLNKEKFENDEIPKEVLLHEETHAQQNHSLDVLLIEVLQIVFWFNPLIYLVKKDIKLNHEFLADQAVIQKGIQPVKYQELLLAFSSNALEPQLANAINYSSIKKRLTVMKTQTKKTTLWFRSLALVPLLALLVYSFSSREFVEKDIETQTSMEDLRVSNNESLNTKHTARSISIEVLSNGNYMIDNISATKNTFETVVNTLHQDITQEIRNRILNIHVSSSNNISNEDTWFIYDALLDYGFHRMVTDNQEIVLSKGNTPFAIENNNPQKGASREQMTEYNKLAKYYNSMSKKDMRIKMKDVERMKYIYGLMSKKQRADAEPFPDFPEPPPSPEAPKVSNIPPPPPPIPANATPEQRAKYEKAHKDYAKKYRVIKGEVSDIPPPPPPPPPPKEPLDHVIDMAKKGAIFYLNDKKVTSDQAIDALKRNKSLNVQTIGHSSKQPKVYIQTKPIHIKNKKGLPKPTAENSVDHIKTMHKHDAKFYLNNTKITYREALAYVKKNRNADISTSMESNVVIIDKKEKSKENLVGLLLKQEDKLMINGKKTKGKIELTKEELSNLQITSKAGQVTDFKIKFKGKRTEQINANTLNSTAKSYIENLSSGDMVQLFDINDSNKTKNNPVIISIK